MRSITRLARPAITKNCCGASSTQLVEQLGAHAEALDRHAGNLAEHGPALRRHSRAMSELKAAISRHGDDVRDALTRWER